MHFLTKNIFSALHETSEFFTSDKNFITLTCAAQKSQIQ